jgi:hypothetical protein
MNNFLSPIVENYSGFGWKRLAEGNLLFVNFFFIIVFIPLEEV